MSKSSYWSHKFGMETKLRYHHTLLLALHVCVPCSPLSQHTTHDVIIHYPSFVFFFQLLFSKTIIPLQ